MCFLRPAINRVNVEISLGAQDEDQYNREPGLIMRTMLELVIRLHEMRTCCRRAVRNPQLTDHERAAARFHKQIVRGCLPAEVLAHYDRLKETDPELLKSPEVFAMAVIVETWRSLSLAKQKKLVAYFATPVPPAKKARRNATARIPRNSARRIQRRNVATLN
jgi:hypothetical protein